MENPLDILFHGNAQVRVTRFFLHNTARSFAVADIAARSLLAVADVRKEVARLVRIGLIEERAGRTHKVYRTNILFPLFGPLKSLLVDIGSSSQFVSLEKVKEIGEIHAAYASGVFLQREGGRVDLFVVADNVSEQKTDEAITTIEAELGREITYVVLGQKDFRYRLDMMDRFTLEFLLAPHDTIVAPKKELARYIASIIQK